MSEGEDADSVKVAVRMRPFNKTDGENPKCILKMEDQTCTITDPATGEKKDFSFDYCFDSHWNGSGPKPPNYADQNSIWNTLGELVLTNSFKGYNSCLFAYGQSGSGKSFSMTANPDNEDGKGIVPRAARKIFERRDLNKDPLVQQSIEVQMVEIYNEKIKDLLRPNDNPPDGLSIKDHPELGTTLYRERDIWPPLSVESTQQMFAMLNEGVSNMTKAATNLNKESSRAHTVFTLTYTYKKVDERGQPVDIKRAQINLIDLAGSERVAKTGSSAGSKEFKEGININKSLTCLGQVIETLGKNAALRAKGKKEEFVKYRDSVLTMMLKESLGGNSRTIMIAALRPNDANFDETMSTLRYASSAKLIQNKSKVNTSDPKVLVKKLQKELEDMKKALAAAQAGGGPANVVDVGAQERLQRQAEEAEARMDEMRRAFEEQLRQASESKVVQHQVELDRKRDLLPHFVNLHEDAQLSMILCFFFEAPTTRVCRPEAPVPPSPTDIPLSGILIEPEHAVVTRNSAGECFVAPVSKSSRVFHNGVLLQPAPAPAARLSHFDRVQFGASMCFLFVDPVNRGSRIDPLAEGLDWRFAQREQHENALKSLTAGAAMSVGGAEEARARSQRALEEKIMRALPALQEANFVSLQMKRDVACTIHIATEKSLSPSARPEDDITTVSIRASNSASGAEVFWSLDSFLERVCTMRELYHEFTATKRSPVFEDETNDPFFIDTTAQIEVGQARVYLEPLAYLFDINDQVSLLDSKGASVGFLSIQIVPYPLEGEDKARELRAAAIAAGEDESAIASFTQGRLEEIMGRGLVLDIFIKKAMGLSATRNASVQVSYQFFGDARPVRTEPPKDGINVELNHRRRIQINSVNSEFVKFIQEGVLKFDLWAAQKSTSPTENKSSRASFISMLPAATQDGAAELDALEDLIIKANGGSVDKSKDRTNGQRLSTVTEQAQQLIDRINALETSTCTLNADLAAAKMRERDAKQAMESMKKVSLPGSVDRPVSSSLVDVNTNLETAKLTIELKRKEDEVKRLEAELKVALETPKACCLIA